MKTRNALYIAGSILAIAALISLFEKADLIWATLMVVIAILLLVWGYQKDRAFVKACLVQKPSKRKIALVTTGVMAVFFGLGFAVGKLIYLWSH